ncbi:MAG TPA: hypothetical protein VGQ83_19125, partial [Polyangia bacterium]
LSLWPALRRPPGLPAPDLALLEAQAAAAQAGRPSADLEREMRRYRAQLFARLATRYGARP